MGNNGGHGGVSCSADLVCSLDNQVVPALVIGAVDSLGFCLILRILSFVRKLVEGPKVAER